MLKTTLVFITKANNESVVLKQVANFDNLDEEIFRRTVSLSYNCLNDGNELPRVKKLKKIW